jgi:dihydrofolate synthase / folylpolyglutamate synthase
LEQNSLQSRYQQTLDFLFAQLPMYHRVGAAAFKKDLTNTLALCAHLGNPHHQFPTIHVAGTNGKGSVSHFLAAVCQCLGLKTGLYISPHYRDFRERIKINGSYIPKQRVIGFVEKNKSALAEIQPSFFEMCVAMAFDHFAREKVDIAIIEVGLGGRLDSTNVITPLMGVITNISFDHMDMLGHTLPLIAGEKAGIIKPGIPVVIGETHPETAPVFRQKAAEQQAPITFADQECTTSVVAEATNLETWDRTVYRVQRGNAVVYPPFEAQVAGPFQAKNVNTAAQAVAILDQIPGFQAILSRKKITATATSVFPEALAQLRTRTKFQGRWQVIGTSPTILCDSAHNDAGLASVFETILEAPQWQHLHIVTGFVNDKDLSKALRHFPAQAQYYFAKANIPRGLDAELLREKAAEFNLHGKAYSSVPNALKAAKKAAHPNDLILVVGSIFVVAEVI